MTKKELILNKSLELFSSKGFESTSTRSIADAAEVSEGLIFKHFKSKNGLLSALLKIGASKSTPEIQKIKNHKATINGTNLICSKLFLSKLKRVVSGKIKKYKTKRIIGTDPKYPKLNAKPEVFPIFFSFEQLLSKEL